MSRLKNLDQALEDVESRFLYNLPESELNQVDRLFFQLEQAWWFYEDFMADVNPALPHFGHLRTFAEKIFSHCPLLSQSHDKFVELFNDFSAYKSHIPVCGCIMLNPEMTKAVLVCTWKGKSWGFPRGKINENEEPLECAVREAFEECGYDASQQCKEEDQLVVVEESKAIKLFIATNVLESTVFVPQTRKEISEVAFFLLDDFPKSTYAVHPFMPKLKRWISIKLKAQAALLRAAGNNRKEKKSKGNSSSAAVANIPNNTAASLMASPKKNPKEWTSFDTRNADTFSEEITSGSKGWGVSDMFKANARLTGLRYEYDGNPHSFGAYHPQYVNYLQKDKDQKENNVEAVNLLNIDQKSITSSSIVLSGSKDILSEIEANSVINGGTEDILPNDTKLSKKSLRRKKGKDETVIPRLVSDHDPIINSDWIGARLQRPFLFDKQDIFFAIDNVLRDKATIAFDS